MTVDRVREVKAWSGVLELCCKEYIKAPSSSFCKAVVMDAMRNLSTAMDKALEEELRPSETEAVS